MEESVEHSKVRSSVLSVSKVFLDPNCEEVEHVEVDGLLASDITAQEKIKKKKKKHKGGLPSPRRILAFNTSELSKLDERKAEEKCTKSFSKSASFPSNAMPKDNITLVEGFGDTKDSGDYSMLSSSVEEISVLTRATSFPLKSALRGSYEELGIGPRPKMQVKWAPSVWEPPCSTISHTVNKSRSKDPKHGKKGKQSHDSPRKRQDKKKHHKSKGHSGSSIVRSNGAYYIEGGKVATSPLQADSSGGDKTSSSVMALPELESKEPVASDESGEAPGVRLGFSLEIDALGGVHTCGQSLFEPERLACNFLYRQAL